VKGFFVVVVRGIGVVIGGGRGFGRFGRLRSG
jgi:hypothetical protein